MIPRQEDDFATQVKKATKDVHTISDFLINTKFALALSDDKVWADGLLCFYEIFKFFEEELPEELLPKEFHRVAAFEKDFEHFLGKDWKENYEIRKTVQRYLEHLREVNKKKKILLFAYAYQLYMALMSGGQLLQRKRMIARNLTLSKKGDEEEKTAQPGCEATWFGYKQIPELKGKLKLILVKNYQDFDEELKQAYLTASRNVFTYNNELIRSVQGVDEANAVHVLIFVVIAAVAILLKCYFFP